MEHYSVHLDQYISLTSSSSGNFLTPWNIFSAAVLLINHGVWLKQAPGSRASGPGRVGAATLLAPAVLGMEAGSHWDCSKGRWGELGAILKTALFLQELDKSYVLPPVNSIVALPSLTGVPSVLSTEDHL